jgi:5-(carboxyamino)imidazole ribonucleotide mutase
VFFWVCLAFCVSFRILPGMENPKFNVYLVVTTDQEKALLEHSAKTLSDFGIEAQWRKISGDAGSVAALGEELEKQEMAAAIVAGSAGTNLPAALAAKVTIPVLGVPMDASSQKGSALEDVLATVNAGAGGGAAYLAIGKAGAINAALQAIAIASLSNGKLREKLEQFRAEQTAKVMAEKL